MFVVILARFDLFGYIVLLIGVDPLLRCSALTGRDASPRGSTTSTGEEDPRVVMNVRRRKRKVLSRENWLRFAYGEEYDPSGAPACWERAGLKVTRNAPVRSNERHSRPMVSNNEEEKSLFYEMASMEGIGETPRDSCWNGFDLEVVSPEEEQLQVNQFYTFAVRATIRKFFRNESVIGMDGNSIKGTNMFDGLIEPDRTIFFRLMACDVRKRGICTPHVETTKASTFVSESKSFSSDLFSPRHSQEEAKPSGRVPQHVLSVYDGSGTITEAHSTPFYSTRLVAQKHNESLTDGIHYVDYNAEILFSIQVEVPRELPVRPRSQCTFFFLGHVTFFSNASDTHGDDHLFNRFDVANLAPERIFTFSSPEVLVNSDGFRIALAVVLIVIVILELTVLGLLIYHRKNQIMQLSQVPMLLILVSAAIISTCSCYFLLPANDLFCNIVHPLILIPVTVLASTMAGRIWRINAVLSPVLALGRQNGQHEGESKVKDVVMKSLGWLTEWERIFYFCGGYFCERKNRSAGLNNAQFSMIRQKVTLGRLGRLIFVLVLPQCVLQVCMLVLLPAKQVIEFNEMLTMGRSTCAREKHRVSWLGYLLVSIPFLLTVFLARNSRNLPSLFNETVNISNMANMQLVALFIGVPLLAIDRSTIISPDVSVFLYTAMVLSLVLASCWFIVVHKLKMVIAGEKVVVSKLLLSPYNIDRDDGGSSSMFNSSGLSESQVSAAGDTEENKLKGTAPDVSSNGDPLFEPSTDESRHAKKDDIGDQNRRGTISTVSFVEDLYVKPQAGNETCQEDLVSENLGFRQERRRHASLAVGWIDRDGENVRLSMTYSGSEQEDDRTEKFESLKQESAGNVSTKVYYSASSRSWARNERARADLLPTNLVRCQTDTNGDAIRGRREQFQKAFKKSPRNQNNGDLVVEVSKPLPARLDKNILFMKDLLTRISVRSMTGRTIPRHELEMLKLRGKTFGDMCDRLKITMHDDDSPTEGSTIEQGEKEK